MNAQISEPATLRAVDPPSLRVVDAPYRRRPLRRAEWLLAWCDHRKMRDHCRGGCGHLVCDGCGLYWDEGAQC